MANNSGTNAENQNIDPPKENTKHKNSENENAEKDTLNIKELAKEYKKKDKKPKPLINQVIISLSLLFGPILLALVLVFNSFLGSLGDFLLIISGGISILYLISAFYKAWRKSATID